MSHSNDDVESRRRRWIEELIFGCILLTNIDDRRGIRRLRLWFASLILGIAGTFALVNSATLSLSPSPAGSDDGDRHICEVVPVRVSSSTVQKLDLENPLDALEEAESVVLAKRESLDLIRKPMDDYFRYVDPDAPRVHSGSTAEPLHFGPDPSYLPDSNNRKRLRTDLNERACISTTPSRDNDWIGETSDPKSGACGYVVDYAQVMSKEAVRWLANHQELDGRWSSRKSGSSKADDVAETSLALAAMLGNGRGGEPWAAIRHAIEWLMDQQKSDGSFCDSPPSTWTELRPTILAALVLCQRAWLERDIEASAAAQRATEYCMESVERQQVSWKSIRNDADFVSAGWYVQLLRSANRAWIEMDYDVHGQIDEWIAASRIVMHRDPDDSSDFAAARYGPPEQGATHSRSYSSRTWAVGNVAIQYLGHPQVETRKSVLSLVGQFGLPSRDAQDGKADLDYWYFGTVSAFQEGGNIWSDWRTDLKRSVSSHLMKTSDKNGFGIDLSDRSSICYSTVGRTAMIALCLEVGSRYWRLASTEKDRR